MITGDSRESEVLAALNASQAILRALCKKGIFTEQEISDLLTEIASDLDKSPQARAKGAARIVSEMKEGATGH